MKLVKRRSDGGMHRDDDRASHAADSSAASQLHPSPMSWYTIASRASLDMALTLAENGVRCVPPNRADRAGSQGSSLTSSATSVLSTLKRQGRVARGPRTGPDTH
eukprot:5808569-Prymnesium_polylepis.1